MATNKEKTKTKSMKEMFKGYTLYSEKEYKDIWDTAIIVVDTNILLNLYRYSEESRKAILNLLKTFKDRLWVPYQVGKEYFSNRDKVIKDYLKEIDTLKSQMTKSFEEIDRLLKSKEKNYAEVAKLEELFNDFRKNVENEFNKITNSSKKNSSAKENLKIEGDILSLIDDHIGEEPDKKDYEEMVDEGLRRIKEQIPPGYKDGAKKEKYNGKTVNGDYIVFKSFMNYAKSNKKHVIFITEDTKEDWFQDIAGEKIGSRPELLHEFYEGTGKLLLIYSFEGFANKYNDLHPDAKLSENVIDEIYQINTSDATKYVKWYKNSNDIKNINSHFYFDFDAIQNDIFKYYNSSLMNNRDFQLLLKYKLRELKEKIKNYDTSTEFNEETGETIINNIKEIINMLPQDDNLIKEEALEILKGLRSELTPERKNFFQWKTNVIIDLIKEFYLKNKN